MEPSLAATAAAEIRAQMGRQKLTQTALAKRMGKSPRTVSRILNEESYPIDLDQLQLVAEFLGIDPRALLPECAA